MKKLLKIIKRYLDSVADSDSYYKKKHMYAIPDLPDKIEALRQYIDYNQDEHEGDAWHYLHNPIIEAHINTFSKDEADRFCNVYMTWDETLFTDLADPFLEVKNSFIDGIYEYSRIFLLTKDIMKKEYLLQNLHIIISPIDKYSTSHLELLLLEVKALIRKLPADRDYS